MSAIGPGSKVRCINDSFYPHAFPGGTAMPVYYGIYTVTWIAKQGEFFPGSNTYHSSFTCLGLVEYPQSFYFKADHFSPIDDSLEKMRLLADKPIRVDSPVKKTELV